MCETKGYYAHAKLCYNNLKMILLDRVTKSYGKEMKPALNRVSLFIQPKEFVIMVGTSGAGKSTLLKLLTREEKPTSGKIVVGGIDYDTLKDKDIPLLRRKIGVVFQDFKLLPQRTVFENVAFALEIAGMTKLSEKSLALEAENKHLTENYNKAIATLDRNKYPSNLKSHGEINKGLNE